MLEFPLVKCGTVRFAHSVRDLRVTDIFKRHRALSGGRKTDGTSGASRRSSEVRSPLKVRRVCVSFRLDLCKSGPLASTFLGVNSVRKSTISFGRD